MPEVKIYLIEDDFLELMARALDLRHTVWQKHSCGTSSPRKFASIEEIREAFKRDQFAYILTRDDYTRYAIKFDRDWYFLAGHNGPAIQIYYWRPYEKDGAMLIPAVLICHDSKIMNPNGEAEAAGQPIAAAVRELIAPIRKASKRITIGKQSPYVSDGVEALLKKGFGLSPP